MNKERLCLNNFILMRLLYNFNSFKFIYICFHCLKHPLTFIY